MLSALDQFSDDPHHNTIHSIHSIRKDYENANDQNTVSELSCGIEEHLDQETTIS